MVPLYVDLMPQLVRLAIEAGAATLRYYGSGREEAREKVDGSPVTAADHAAEAVILARLAELTPAVPVVAEEAVAAGEVPDIGDGTFWLVDPLDGTREFLGGNGEFTVNIALIENGLPVLGVVHAPALGLTYSGIVGQGARLAEGNAPSRPIAARTPPDDGIVVVASRRHGDQDALADHLDRYRVVAERRIGSSLKFCLLATGEADLYPRFGRTMEWDTAAGDAVLRAAGGSVRTVDGETLRYGKREFENPYFVGFGKWQGAPR